jgi:hypothetical protein
MINLDDLLNIDIENLANAQYDALKKHTIDKLRLVIELLEIDDLQGVADLLKFSPDGDGWGSENHFIDFSYNDRYNRDLGDILEQMASLKNEKIKLERKM